MENIKFDELACFTHESEVASFNLKDSKYLILESDFRPGYYSKGDFPQNKANQKEHYLYLPVKKTINCFQDEVLRVADKINNKEKTIFHVSPGQMTYSGTDYQCIRIKATEINNLMKLINELKEIGIKFFKHREVKPYISEIHHKEFVSFKKVGDGIFQDNDNREMHFIHLPKNIEFNVFLDLVGTIKNNCSFHLFDAMLVSVFTKDKVHDFAGIYSKHCEESRLPEFKLHIEKEIAKID